MEKQLIKITLFLFLFSAANSLFAAGNFILGPGDIVKITVYQYPDLDTQTRIGENGTINFPLIGEVKIGGMNERQAESTISSILREGKYVKSPQVTLMVEQHSSQQVSVLGEVKNPGKYSLEDGNSVIDIIALAGGITPKGSDTVIVSRFGTTSLRRKINLNTALRDGDLNQDWTLQKEDIIFVPRMEVFYIYGQVNKPGVYRLDNNLTMMQAVAMGGSLTDRGTLRGISVQRKVDNGETVTQDVQLDDAVMPDDVITVEESLF